jgi:hypothetical protein
MKIELLPFVLFLQTRSVQLQNVESGDRSTSALAILGSNAAKSNLQKIASTKMNLGRPFLTDLDPRERIKGSRDPLGFQPIWAALGRELVDNLTTVTVSLRGFTTVLLGFYHVDRLIEEEKISPDRYTDTFIKFEQLAAYSRVACRVDSANAQYNEDEIRGIMRVLRNLSEGPVRVSAQQKHQILSSQRMYGLWGLYTVASRSSGILDAAQIRLSLPAKEFVENEYVPRLGPESLSVYKFLERDRDFEPKGKDLKLAKAISGLMGPQLSKEEQQFYLYRLLYSGKENGIQQQAWEKMYRLYESGTVSWEEAFCYDDLRELIKQSRSSGDNDLASRFENVGHLESVIAPAGRFFSFLLSRNNQPVDAIAKQVKSTWGDSLKNLDPLAFREALIAAGEAASAEEIDRLVLLADQLKKADYRSAIETMNEQNRVVMQERGAAPWLTTKRGKLDVRLGEESREEPRQLPARGELKSLWANSYFLGSLKRIGYQILKAG